MLGTDLGFRGVGRVFAGQAAFERSGDQIVEVIAHGVGVKLVEFEADSIKQRFERARLQGSEQNVRRADRVVVKVQLPKVQAFLDGAEDMI